MKSQVESIRVKIIKKMMAIEVMVAVLTVSCLMKKKEEKLPKVEGTKRML